MRLAKKIVSSTAGMEPVEGVEKYIETFGEFLLKEKPFWHGNLPKEPNTFPFHVSNSSL
jgi:hypothetical protein